MAYTPKTQLAAEPYIKDGLTTILLGNTEYVRLRDIVGKDLKSYRRHCSEGSTILVNVNSSPTWFVRTTEIDKLKELRNLNQQRYRACHGLCKPKTIASVSMKNFFKKLGELFADEKPDELDKPKSEVAVPTKELFTKFFGMQFSEEEPVVVNGVEVFTSPDFGSIRTKLEKDGTVYFNLEDVARGMGFTKTEEKFSPTSGRKSYDSIRWERVNGYLKEFNFMPTSGHGEISSDTFIPENIFYRLAMKAKNEVAEKFQVWISDEVLPKMRKQGYCVRPDIKPVQDNNANELLEALKVRAAIQDQIIQCLQKTKIGS